MRNTTHDHPESPWWTVALVAAPLLTIPQANASGFPRLAAPWLVVAMLAPLVGAQARRIWRASEREKRALQEKFEREDAALLDSSPRT